MAALENGDNPEIVLIIGGAGFLGSHIVERLLDRVRDGEENINEIIIFDVKQFDEELCPNHHGVKINSVIGSVTSINELKNVMKNVTELYHCASIVDFHARTHIPKHILDVNVIGTKNVIQVAKEFNVKRLVYTSTLDVVVGWDDHNILNGDESMPYPKDIRDFMYGAYGQTKAWAEKDSIEANKTKTANGSFLHTCSIRPVGLYGDRDPYHVPNFLQAAEQGLLKFRMGYGKCNHAYAGNVAFGHVCAMSKLREIPDKVGGQIYFVKDDGTDESFFDFMEPFCKKKGYSFPSKRRTAPKWLMMCIALIIEYVVWFISPIYEMKPLLTPIAVGGVTSIHLFSDSKARNELGYKPVFSEKQAKDRTMRFFGLDPDT